MINSAPLLQIQSSLKIFEIKSSTVNPREFVSSNVDLAKAAFRVSFRASNSGGLMNTMYGLTSGVRSIFNA